jgi:hypothetical protein
MMAERNVASLDFCGKIPVRSTVFLAAIFSDWLMP